MSYEQILQQLDTYELEYHRNAEIFAADGVITDVEQAQLDVIQSIIIALRDALQSQVAAGAGAAAAADAGRQSEIGGLAVTVRDAQGQAISGAQVSVTTGQQVSSTDQNGVCGFDALPAGETELQIDFDGEGYDSCISDRQSFFVEPDQTSSVDVTLDLTAPEIQENESETPSSISASVGKGGVNNEEDVRVVQELLKIKVTGQVDPKTIAAIEDVQRQIFDGRSDGVVEPGEETWKYLTEARHGGDDGSGTEDENSSGGTGDLQYENTTGKLLYEDKARAKHGDAFIEKVKEICGKLGLEPDFLMATIAAECNFDHKAVNPHTQASGLIQFMPFTAEDLGTTIQEIRKMSALEQLDFVYLYFKNHGNKVKQVSEPAESYLIVFYPYAVGQPDSYVLGSQVSPQRVALIAEQNGIYDLNKDGQITKGEIMEYMRKNKYKDAYEMMEKLSKTDSDDGEPSRGMSGGTMPSAGEENTDSTEGGDTDAAQGHSIIGSVGDGGDNNEADVRIVQELLKKKGYSLSANGRANTDTINAINQFQEESFDGWSDGLIEPGKKTWEALTGSSGGAAAGTASHTGLATVQMTNQGAKRNLPITSTLMKKLRTAIGAVFGTIAVASVYSGGQPSKGSGGVRTGSVRHDLGHAADLTIVVDGSKVETAGMQELGKWWRDNNYGCVGIGMQGGRGIHLDEWGSTTGPKLQSDMGYSWTY